MGHCHPPPRGSQWARLASGQGNVKHSQSHLLNANSALGPWDNTEKHRAAPCGQPGPRPLPQAQPSSVWGSKPPAWQGGD